MAHDSQKLGTIWYLNCTIDRKKYNSKFKDVQANGKDQMALDPTTTM
jgi:hypothetical protein